MVYENVPTKIINQQNTMIKSTELRIGNIVEPLTMGPSEVTGILTQTVRDGILTLIYVEEKSFLPEHINGVIITNDYIQKCVIDSDYKVSLNNNGRYSISIRSSEGSYYDTIVTEVKYIHELQNLYFALTSTELTLKQQ